jgi:hypothetical protein
MSCVAAAKCSDFLALPHSTAHWISSFAVHKKHTAKTERSPVRMRMMAREASAPHWDGGYSLQCENLTRGITMFLVSAPYSMRSE